MLRCIGRGRGWMALALAGLWLGAAGADEPKGTPESKDASKAARPASESADPKAKQQTLGIVLYPRFELLDVFGPAEVFGNVGKHLKIVMVAEQAGPVASTQGPKAIADFGFEDCPPLDFVLVPGGIGTIRQLSNKKMHEWLKQRAETAQVVMSVCSGSAILAKAGLLDGKRATTNKQSFRLLTNQHKNVEWVEEARWVDEGNRVTSSGVSAGIDMSLHMVERLWGKELAQGIADGTEYEWHQDPDWDPFVRFIK